MRSFVVLILSVLLLECTDVASFSPAFVKVGVAVNPSLARPSEEPARLSPLFMGRAAAVRAATKSKTDAKKAKINAVYGKRIIMAVKQGGGPDPESNTVLRDVIKSAKANSVPVDVSLFKPIDS